MECDTFRASTRVYEKGHKSSQSEDCNGSELYWYQNNSPIRFLIMLESLERSRWRFVINCRNTMCISRMLRSILQEESQSRPSLRLAHSSIPIIRRRARHYNAPKLVSMSPRFIRAQGTGFCPMILSLASQA